MATKLSTLNNLDIAILEPKGSIIGGDETDELKTKAKDLLEQGNKKLVIDLGGVTYEFVRHRRFGEHSLDVPKRAGQGEALQYVERHRKRFRHHETDECLRCGRRA